MSKKYTTNEVIAKFKTIHGEKYDYSRYIYPNRKELKGIVICPLHGEFETTRMHHEKGVGCPDCAGVPRGGFKKTKDDDFLNRMNSLFGDTLNFEKFKYVNNYTKGSVTCPVHGEFQKAPKHLYRGQGCSCCSGKSKLTTFDIQSKLSHTPYRLVEPSDYINNKTKMAMYCDIHDHTWNARMDNVLHGGTRCPLCAASISKIEQELQQFVRDLDVGVKFNIRDVIKPFELDVYIPSHNLAIELNGLYFHAESCGKNKMYHLQKTKMCADQNIQLLHIFEDEWRGNANVWKSVIQNKLKMTHTKHHARKCKIVELSVQTAATFFERNHLQGYSKCSVRLGLEYCGELIAVLTMGKSRFDNNIEWEICRFANTLNTTTVGGFQKLLKYFIKTHNPISIVTYADKRYSNGGVYSHFGMIEKEDTPCNYFYFRKQECIRHSRHKFQKHKLSKMLPKFNTTLSESENMKLHGYDKIWDCGSKKYVWYR